MTNKLVRRVVAVIAAMFMITGGIAGTANAATRTLTVGDVSDPAPSFYDGVRYSDGQAFFFEALFDELFIKVAPAAKLAVKPGLAKSYKLSSDNKKLTLQLRNGVKFSDGTLLTPEVVKANLDRRSDKTIPSYSKFDVGGTQEITSVEVRGVDVVITFKAAQPNAPYHLSGPSGFIVSGAAAKDSNLTKSTVYGSGPYTLDVKKTIKGNTYRMVKNASHWNAASYPFDVIVYKVYASSQAQANASAAGQLDITLQPAGTTVPLLKARKVGLLAKGGQVYMLQWWDKLGKNSAFTKDKNARLAFMYAIDRNALVNGIFKGDRATSSLVGKSSLGYSSYLDKTYTYNPAKAKQMLADAGFSSITFNQNVNTNDAALFQALKEQLAKVGVTMNLDINSDGAKGFASVRTGTMGIFSFDTNNLVAYAGLTLNSFPNYQGATNAAIGGALGALAGDPTNAAKAEALNRALVEEGWATPIRESYSYTGYKTSTIKKLVIGARGDVWPLLSEVKPLK